MRGTVCLGANPEPFSIHWVRDPDKTNRLVVEVAGLSTPDRLRLSRTEWSTRQWQQLLSVRTETESLIDDVGLPPMAGSHRVVDGRLRFTPQFPLTPGVRYRATFRPNQLPEADRSDAEPVTAVFEIPAQTSAPETVVSHIFPSADVLPENLLKFYVHFSAPMSRGRIYDHIHLRNEVGADIELPFLEIDEELWDPAMRRLTLFIDPGRIKRGVRPLEEIGPALESGHRFTLVIDPAWRDAAGNALKQGFEKRFRVGPPDREPPDPSNWRVAPPESGTRDRLSVTFPEAMDHALAQRMIHVVRDGDKLLDGKTALENEERRLTFVPEAPWRRGEYKLVVQTTIEDLAGNNIGKTFEVDLFEGVQRRFTNATVKLPFRVR